MANEATRLFPLHLFLSSYKKCFVVSVQTKSPSNTDGRIKQAIEGITP